jgi:hypothetical protein
MFYIMIESSIFVICPALMCSLDMFLYRTRHHHDCMSCIYGSAGFYVLSYHLLFIFYIAFFFSFFQKCSLFFRLCSPVTMINSTLLFNLS